MQGLVASANAGGVLVDTLPLGGREVDGVTGDSHADTIKADVSVILNEQNFFIVASSARRPPLSAAFVFTVRD